MDSKAQISIELIVIMAALIVVALVLVNRFYATSQSASKKISDSTDSLMDKIDEIGKLSK